MLNAGMASRGGNADSPDGALARERRSSGPHRENWPAPRPRGPRNRVPPIATKRGDGLERRPPVGTARERETSADDAAPCQRDRRTLSELRMARMPTAPSPGAAFFSSGAR